MMHLTFDGKGLLVGDDAAELVVEYAAALARSGGADTVRLTAYGADGAKVEALLLLDQGAPVMAETSDTDLPDPDNEDIASYMREQLARIGGIASGIPAGQQGDPVSDFENDFEFNS